MAERVIIQIFARAIITCHRCHCCCVSPFVPGLVQPRKSRRCYCPDAHLISAINRRLQPAHESPRLCLKAVHLLLRGCVAMAEHAGVQVPPVRSSTSGVGGCRKYMICACRHLCIQRGGYQQVLQGTQRVISSQERKDPSLISPSVQTAGERDRKTRSSHNAL